MSSTEQLQAPVKRSTKVCRCGSTALITFKSLNRKRCSNCNKLMYWPLDEGQEPLNGSHRAGRKSKDKDQ